MRRLVVFILSVFALQGHAQVMDKVRHILVGDTAAPPNYDTAYVATYRSNLIISAVAKFRTIDVDLERAQSDGLSCSTNNTGQYGFGLNYKWLNVETTFNIPALDDHDASLGNTNSRGFGLGIPVAAYGPASSGTIPQATT